MVTGAAADAAVRRRLPARPHTAIDRPVGRRQARARRPDGAARATDRRRGGTTAPPPHPPPAPNPRKRTEAVAESPSKRKVPTAWQSQVVAAAMARLVVVRKPKEGTIAADRAAASGRVATASPRGRASRGSRNKASVTTARTQVSGARLPPPAPMPPLHRQR